MVPDFRQWILFKDFGDSSKNEIDVISILKLVYCEIVEAHYDKDGCMILLNNNEINGSGLLDDCFKIQRPFRYFSSAK